MYVDRIAQLVLAAGVVSLFPHLAYASAAFSQTGGIPGVVVGVGSHFQVTDSEYLNVSVSSTEAIKLRLTSVPKVLTMRLESSSGSATSTQITIAGLAPDTTYYQYEDNLHNLTQIVSSDDGTYTYTQDISEAHIVFIQERHSTKFIFDDATGGDCISFGTWDAATLTCTLTSDISETIEIDSDGVTIDGAGHTMDGSQGVTMGVYLDARNGITVKDLTIKNFSYGVFLNASSHITVAGTAISDAGIISFDSSEDAFTGDTFSGNDRTFISFNSSGDIMRDDTISGSADADGVFLFTSTGGTIASSTFSGLGQALFLYDGSDDIAISGNTFTGLGDALFLYDSYDNTITENTLSDSQRALFVYGSSHGNTMYHNNFLRNGTNALDYSDTLNNNFSLPNPVGGNYFDSFDEPSEGCNDAGGEGLCDAPNVFAQYYDAGQDAFPWTTQDGWDKPSSPKVSNVLFLPGIEGSRLYEGTGCGKTVEEKLWEPLADSFIQILFGAGDKKVKDLFLDPAGESVCGDIYAKADDVIDSVGGSDIYKSFIGEMDGLKADGTITDWKPVAYDWRLSLNDLLTKGTERDGKIYYEESTSTPYIEQTLRALAASSKSGKVDIVAHSNGGLVAKALLNQLGSETPALVDKVILVGAPQSGAPVDVGALLYGLDQGISSWGIPILHSSVARSLALNSPMAYHLLPSEDYLESTMGDAAHPVARFAGDGYAAEIAAYGATIANRVALDDFLLAKDGGREKPGANDVSSAEVLNAPLIDYANNAHAALDAWAPPDGVEVDQIAGWGADTVAGIDFYTMRPTSVLAALGPMRMYRPIFVEDGDGTVPIPSALMMASSTNVKRYWVDLDSYRIATSIKRSHRDLFEIPSLEDFIKNIIKNSNTLTPYITSSQPSPTSDTKKLIFFLHSSITPPASTTPESESLSDSVAALQLKDPSGKTVGLAEDGSMTEDIPGSSYGEFGEVKYAIIPEPQGNQYQLMLYGRKSGRQTDSGQTGTFSLDIQESSGGIITASSTIANVPVTASTTASLTISGDVGTASPLTVDENGDSGNIITITPVVGETVSYEPPVPDPDTEPVTDDTTDTSNTGGASDSDYPPQTPANVAAAPVRTSPGSISIPIITTVAVPIPAATTTPVATTTRPQLAVAIPRARKHSAPAKAPPLTIANTVPNFPQTASVYDASQQPMVERIGTAIYNSIHGLWTALQRLF